MQFSPLLLDQRASHLTRRGSRHHWILVSECSGDRFYPSAHLLMTPFAERRAVECWSRDHTTAVGQLNIRVADTYAAAKDRLIVAKEDIKVVSAAVLDAVSDQAFMLCPLETNSLGDLAAHHSGASLRQALLSSTRSHCRPSTVQQCIHCQHQAGYGDRIDASQEGMERSIRLATHRL